MPSQEEPLAEKPEPRVTNPVPVPAQNLNQQKPINTPKQTIKKGPNIALVIFVSVIITVAICACLYFFVIKPKDKNEDKGTPVEVSYASVDNEGDKTNEETVEEYNKAISAAEEEEKLDLILNKVGYHIAIEEYDEALAVLHEINTEPLSKYDKYRVYNYYSSAYREMGDTDKAEEYHRLAEENNSLEDLKETE